MGTKILFFIENHLLIIHKGTIIAKLKSSIILAVVVGNTTRGDIITLNESYTAAPVSLPTAVSELRFQLKDVTGKIVDLEGHDMSFALATQ